MPDPSEPPVDPKAADAAAPAGVEIPAVDTADRPLVQVPALELQNFVDSQNTQDILQQAATTQGVEQLLSIDTLSDAEAEAEAEAGLAESLRPLKTNE